MGMERFVALYEECGGEAPAQDADVYLVAVGDAALKQAFAIAEELRDSIAGIRVDLNLGGGSFKTQMKRADKSNARYALILGEQEIIDRTIGLKPLRTKDDQISVSLDDLPAVLAGKLDEAAESSVADG